MYSITAEDDEAEVQRRAFMLIEEAYGERFRERAQDWNQYDRMVTIAAENGIDPVPANADEVAYELARATVGSVQVHVETLEFATDADGQATDLHDPFAAD